ncbi:MAG: hypothetical protein ACREJT_14250 [Myxococcota bacterium]
MSAPRVHVVRGGLPLALAALVLAPLALVFLTSLLLAAGVVVAGAGLAALLFARRRPPVRRQDPNTIELDASQFRRLEPRGPRHDRH